MAKKKILDNEIRRNKTERKRELINVAAQLFKISGYDKTTVRDIADKVGITSGSIFYYFNSKEDLLEAVIFYGISSGLEVVEKELKKKNTPLGRFHALVYAHLLALHGDPGSAHEVSFREWSRLPNDAKKRLKGLNERYKFIWNQELFALKEAGILKSDPEICRRIMNAALNWSPVWLKSKTKKSYEDTADHFCSVILNITKQDFSSMRIISDIPCK